MSPRKKKKVSGGINISSVNVTVSGDIVGGDRVMAGDSTTDAPPPAVSKLFAEISRIIEERPNDPNVDKDELKDTVKYIEREASKGDSANTAKLARWLQSVAEIAPDMFEVLIATITNPALGLSATIRKTAQKTALELYKK